MMAELAPRSALEPYGLGPKYGRFMLGDLEMIAAKVDIFNDPEFTSVTVTFRTMQSEPDMTRKTHGNLLITAEGFTADLALQKLKTTMDSIIGEQS